MNHIPLSSALWAVIPAAGLSSRMHRYKPLLKLGDRTMIQQTIGLFKNAGIDDILVVTGHNRELLESVIRGAGAGPVHNPDYLTGMLGSIQTGFRNVPNHARGVFLLPVDIAAVRPATVRIIADAFLRDPDRLIIPEFNGETGHPPVIPSRLIPDILALSGDTPLRDLLLEARPRYLTVHDRGILMDADTPEGFDRMDRKFSRLDIPDTAECRSILDNCLAPDEPVRAHLEKATEVAVSLTEAVNKQAGTDNQLNLDLTRAAALLHDICRKDPDHAAAGARFLKDLGFPGVAEIVGRHMDLGDMGPGLSEAQVVYFADKICDGDTLVPDIDVRFALKMETDPQARDQIKKRHEDTRNIQTRIEAICGRSVRSVLR